MVMIFAVDMIDSDSAPAHYSMLQQYKTFFDAENMFPHRPYSSFFIFSENEIAATTAPFPGVPEIQEQSLTVLGTIPKRHIQQCFRWC
jgi:hypothetical protein